MYRLWEDPPSKLYNMKLHFEIYHQNKVIINFEIAITGRIPRTYLLFKENISLPKENPPEPSKDREKKTTTCPVQGYGFGRGPGPRMPVTNEGLGWEFPTKNGS